MSRRRIRQACVIPVAVVISLFGVAGPAGATTPMEVTDGYLQISHPFNPPVLPMPDTACGTATIDATFTGSPVNTITIDAVAISSRFVSNLTGKMAEITLDGAFGASQSGAVIPSSPAWISGVDLGLRADLYDDANGDCVPDGGLRCQLSFVVELDGSFVGSPGSPSIGDELHALVSPAVPLDTADVCHVPFAGQIGEDVSGEIHAMVV